MACNGITTTNSKTFLNTYKQLDIAHELYPKEQEAKVRYINWKSFVILAMSKHDIQQFLTDRVQAFHRQ